MLDLRVPPLLALALLTASCGERRSAGGGAPRPRDSQELQAIARQEDARFQRAVVDESRAPRLDVEAVSAQVLVHPPRRLVYVLRPSLVALDLATGTERWQLPDVTGDSLWRVGRWLVALDDESTRRPRLAFVDPAAPRSPRVCPLDLPIPRAASEVQVTPFDRGGVPHVAWTSRAARRRGGPPPTPDEEANARAGVGCGVATVDPPTCEVTPVGLRGFLLSPPRDRGGAEGVAPDDCDYLSPQREMPAVAASRAPEARPSSDGEVALVTSDAPESADGCARRITVTLEARDPGGGARWKLALPERRDTTPCPGPP